jgi:glutathione S-transferase
MILILYGAPVSPFVRKVLAFAAEKGVALELVPIGLGDQNPDFLSASPFRKMPGFRDGDFCISDSTAIVTYIEAKHPEPALLPADPAGRARAIWYDEFADTILVAAAGPIFFNRVVSPKFMGKPGDDAAAAKGEADMTPICDYLEGVIPPSGFLLGDTLTLADISVASPFVNASHAGYIPDATDYPRLTAYLAMMHARPSFADWIRRERKMLGLV